MTGEQLLIKTIKQCNAFEEEVKSLRPAANSWDRVWNDLCDHPLVREVSEDHARDGNCSRPVILICAFEKAVEGMK